MFEEMKHIIKSALAAHEAEVKPSIKMILLRGVSRIALNVIRF